MIRTRKYILVTPVKNEEKALPKLAESILNQTIRPILWVIVDDGSTDKTPFLIQKLSTSYPWIQSIQLPSHPRDIVFHYPYVCKIGFKYALDYIKKKYMYFEYIGLVDADTVLEVDYFEKLIREFEKDKHLGIASGSVYIYKKNKGWIREARNLTQPRGTGRLWRRQCFFDTGGYRLVPAPDSVSNRLAIKKGWKIAQFNHVRAYQLRPTSSAEGLIKGYIKTGKVASYLRVPFTSALASAIWYWFKLNPIVSLSFIFGYIQGGSVKQIYIPRNIQELFEKRDERLDNFLSRLIISKT